MADFTLWGCAVARALGHSQDEFLGALDENFADRNDEIIASSPVATATAFFMAERESWDGTASELLAELEPIAPRCGVSIKARLWPKGANALSRRLNEVAANLAASGIGCQQSRTGNRRHVKLQKVRCPTTPPTAGAETQVSSRISSPQKGAAFQANDDVDDGDDVSGSRTDPPSVIEDQAATRKVSGNIVTPVTTVIGAEQRLFPGDDIGDGNRKNNPRRRRVSCKATNDDEVAL